MHVLATILEVGICVKDCPSVRGESVGFLLQHVRLLNTLRAETTFETT